VCACQQWLLAFGFWNFIWASKQAYQEEVSSDPIYVRALP